MLTRIYTSKINIYENYYPVHYTITEGETLWHIALREMPVNGDPREYVYKLRELNEIDGRDFIQEGQEILILTKGDSNE